VLDRKKRLTVKELTAEMEERSRKVIDRFGLASVSGVNNPLLQSYLEDVRAYWKDNFRPALTSFSCEAVGGQPDAADDISLMITLLSAGLGIHDDIIDKSLDKHDRMTILGLHGADNALLLGELFIVKSLTVIGETGRKRSNPEEILQVLKEFESFFIEVWEGEFMETLCRRNLDTELELYQRVLWMSTADTEACAKFGAIIGGGSKNEIDGLARVGRQIGYIHRLGDDAKDALNFEGNLGSRLENESVPLPILYAAKSSKDAYLEIKNILEHPKVDQVDIDKVMQWCFKNDAFEYVRRLTKKSEVNAIRTLHSLKKSEAQEALVSMTRTVYKSVQKVCP
jgi:geranylgeranyl pyrophosphate synthase